MSIAIALHVLAAVVWIGGMFFAFMALRPSVGEVLQPVQAQQLWSHVFSRFLGWVWVAVIVLPLTGYWIIYGVWGGMQYAGMHVHLMQGLGWIMILAFLHLFFAPYRRLRRSVQSGDIETAGRQLGQIRVIVGANLALGLLVVLIASGGRFL